MSQCVYDSPIICSFLLRTPIWSDPVSSNVQSTTPTDSSGYHLAFVVPFGPHFAYFSVSTLGALDVSDVSLSIYILRLHNISAFNSLQTCVKLIF